MVQINWTKQSTEDLKDIFDYISNDSIKFAKFQVIRIRTRVKILYTYPQSGKVVYEIKNDAIRELIEQNYRIIYRIVSQSQIDILTVHHTSRDLLKRNIQ